MLVLLFELTIALLFFALVLSQLLIPAWRGTPFFPFFRKENKLSAELSDVRQDKVEAQLKADIKRTKKGV